VKVMMTRKRRKKKRRGNFLQEVGIMIIVGSSNQKRDVMELSIFAKTGSNTKELSGIFTALISNGNIFIFPLIILMT